MTDLRAERHPELADLHGQRAYRQRGRLDDAEVFHEILEHRWFLSEAEGRDVGTVFKNPELARTYELLAKGGANAFYAGPVANAIVQTVKSPPVAAGANHRWRAGVMELSDLQAYTAKQRAPVRVRYLGRFADSLMGIGT